MSQFLVSWSKENNVIALNDPSSRYNLCSLDVMCSILFFMIHGYIYVSWGKSLDMRESSKWRGSRRWLWRKEQQHSSDWWLTSIWICSCCCCCCFYCSCGSYKVRWEHKTVVNERTAALFRLAAYIWCSSPLPEIKRGGDILLQILFAPVYCLSLLVVWLWLLCCCCSSCLLATRLLSP